MRKKIVENAFITGCDDKTEWQLPWFIDNYIKYNNTPLVVADFGMSEEMSNMIGSHPFVHCVMKLNKESSLKGWFYKPIAMLNIPAKRGVWIDTDCEVLGRLENIFKLIEPNKLLMATDRPWLKRRNEIWHNSGVIGWQGKPEILYKWNQAIQENPQVGDQEVLHSLLNPITKMTYIAELPNIYNWLRLQVEHDGEDSPNKKIMHWTGEKGNDRIRGKMKVKEFIDG
jgi:hypothetical protein